MTIRAVIFDIYKTILEVSPPPADREARWHALWGEMISGLQPRLDLEAFGRACEAVIAREQAGARAAGILHPEIVWPEVVREVLPEVAAMPEMEQGEFIFRHTGLAHTVRLMPGAGEMLRALRDRGIVLGIASNAQPYTLRELAEALAPADLSLADFAEDLRFWSFTHGFSKPDPHGFRLLGARLRLRGIQLSDSLMVGDRLDNDVAPARAQGWQTWHLSAAPTGQGGTWSDLRAWWRRNDGF
jgi:FMN phosphatase YigB (HAD superfamily)